MRDEWVNGPQTTFLCSYSVKRAFYTVGFKDYITDHEGWMVGTDRKQWFSVTTVWKESFSQIRFWKTELPWGMKWWVDRKQHFSVTTVWKESFKGLGFQRPDYDEGWIVIGQETNTFSIGFRAPRVTLTTLVTGFCFSYLPTKRISTGAQSVRHSGYLIY